MSGNSSSINLFGQHRIDNFDNQNPPENKTSENSSANLTAASPSPRNLIGEKNLQGALARRALEQKYQARQATGGEDLNGLSEQKSVPVAVKPRDKQADVLRRAYQTYAATAGLSEENAKSFVEQMMKGGDFLQYHNSTELLSESQFKVYKRLGSIEMYPTGAQIAELRRLKAEQSAVADKTGIAAGEISFQDKTRAADNLAVVRRYLQQNMLSADFYFVDHGDEAARRAVELGVKPQIEEAGKNEAGEFVYRIKITAADAEKLQQVKTEYAEKKAQFEEKTAQAQSEVNQMFADQGRVLWNSAVNNVEGTINLGLDELYARGGQDPLYYLNPNRPQVDFSGAKTDYRSEMMRRDLNGKLDGDGIKAGQAIETVVTFLAPLVVGKVTTPIKPPQTLKSLGGLPDFVVKPKKWDFFFDREIKPDAHNTPRAIQNKSNLAKLGILDDAAGQEKLLNLFEKGLKLSEKERRTSQFGITVTKHVKVSETGGIDVKYFYPNGNMLAKPQISTIIPKIYEIK